MLNSEGGCIGTDGEGNANNDCCTFFELKAITNGDRLRQMSNEELAVLLNQVDYNIQEAFHGRRDLFSSCYDMWLAWLNAPAESEVDNG